ncbi:DNA/RNA non-specific endonuclease [Rossellomorea vietnamensis]|uniref:DNA/RNA non-specific endonuclease n=1 Tax=Rossellomorea vietnamensis TaxID=218284 RepID=UPI001E5EE7F2|nr:DNA/RNA non-specific endonuclease [Rossellomorea vietnamensis]MCC5803764.1 hypothetical protein [Rossellomorea vietnamensis]
MKFKSAKCLSNLQLILFTFTAWAKALRDKREVIVDIRPVYEGNSVRPVRFNIKYRMDVEKFKASLKKYMEESK